MAPSAVEQTVAGQVSMQKYSLYTVVAVIESFVILATRYMRSPPSEPAGYIYFVFLRLERLDFDKEYSLPVRSPLSSGFHLLLFCLDLTCAFKCILPVFVLFISMHR